MIEFYHPRSAIGTLIVGLHDPEIRSTAVSYLGEAWTQIKHSTATISPEAANKLERDLEPFAIQTLSDIEDRMEK